jgi:MacB-like periplasmic core domain
LAARVIFWLHLIRDWMLSALRAQGETAAQDLRSASGGLRRRPLSTGALVLLFSVVVSGNTCLVTIANAMLFHPLPYDTSGRLVYLAQARSAGAVDWQPIPIDLARIWRDRSHALTDLSFFSEVTTDLGGAPVHVFLVSPQVLKNLEITAEYGRLPEENDETAATLGPRLWERLYGGSRSALGATFQLLGRKYRVAGVVKEQPDFPFDADVWLPLPHDTAYAAVFGRLKPGLSLRDAQTEGREIQRRARNDFPIQLAWLRDSNLDPRYGFILSLLEAAFLAALLLTCADLGILQFAHIQRRRRDVGIRMAVGASRGRLLRFLLAETLLMAIAAVALSLPLTIGAISFLREKMDWWGLHRIAGWSSIRFGGSTVAAALGMGLASGMLGAILPSWRLVNRNVWAVVQPPSEAEDTAGRLRVALLGSQFGLAVLAFFLAVAFSTEADRRLASPAIRFFDGAWQAMLPAKGSRAEASGVLRRIVKSLESRGYAPLVAWPPPFLEEPGPFQCESAGRRLLAEWMSVNGRFFQIPGFRWRSGRVWTEEEATHCDRLRVVVNEPLARGSGDAPRQIVLVNSNGRRVDADIVGVVDQPSLDLYQTRAGPMIFIPYQCATISQRDVILPAGHDAQAALGQAVREADALLQPVVRDFARRLDANALAWRIIVAGLWCAAMLSLGLALTGMAAYLVQTFAERRHEMAMRCALGGIAHDIWTLLARQVAAALVLGTLLAGLFGMGVLRLPTGMTPAPGGITMAAAAAVLLLWSLWGLASRFASERAAAVRLIRRLRHV